MKWRPTTGSRDLKVDARSQPGVSRGGAPGASRARRCRGQPSLAVHDLTSEIHAREERVEPGVRAQAVIDWHGR